MEPKPSLWLAIAKDGRVKYTTDSGRASGWKKSGSYRLVRDYYTTPVHASDISVERVDETSKCKHEPVAYVSGYTNGECVVAPMNRATVFSVGTGFYTALPKREWVGLTDEEIDTWNIVGHESLREFVRAIEAKLKEKNT